MVRAAAATATSASISTPVCALVRTRASILCLLGRRCQFHTDVRQWKWMTQWNRRRLLGGHDAGKPCGLERVALCDRATANRGQRAPAHRDRPRAIASRWVIGLSPTSTIVTRPRGSTCDSPVRPAFAAMRLLRAGLRTFAPRTFAPRTVAPRTIAPFTVRSVRRPARDRTTDSPATR